MPLASLATQTVTLPSGQQLVVPKLVHEMCSFILDKVETEGIFRKGGSRSRQNEIRVCCNKIYLIISRKKNKEYIFLVVVRCRMYFK